MHAIRIRKEPQGTKGGYLKKSKFVHKKRTSEHYIVGLRKNIIIEVIDKKIHKKRFTILLIFLILKIFQ